MPLTTFFFLVLPLALLIATLLLAAGLNLYHAWQNAEPAGIGLSGWRQHTGVAAAAVLFLSLLLLAGTLYSLYWLTVRDNTYDPLGYLWLGPLLLVVLFAGVLLPLILPDRIKFAGLLYLLLIPILIVISALAQRVDFRQVTEARAGRVSQAIEAYYARHGRYPHDLRQLTRWPFPLPGPIIIYGQTWCYDSGHDYYRLGYITRRHWSDPRLIGRIYKTAGPIPPLPRMCHEEVIALQKRRPDYPYSYWLEEEQSPD